MSDDPRDRYGDNPHNPIGDASHDPYGSPAPDPYAQQTASAVRGRVVAPAIFLIVVGVLNLVFGGLEIAAGAINIPKSPADLKQEQVDMFEQMFADSDLQETMVANAEKQDPQTIYNQTVWGNIGIGVFWLVVSLVTLFGAVRMMGLKSYGLAVAGAILAAIPLVSFPGACCFIGEIAGIWALIVLMNGDVRAAFR